MFEFKYVCICMIRFVFCKQVEEDGTWDVLNIAPMAGRMFLGLSALLTGEKVGYLWKILSDDIIYGDVIMNPMTSQITCVSIVCLTVCSDRDQRKYWSSASLAFVRGIHRWPVNSPHKGYWRGKGFNDVILWWIWRGTKLVDDEMEMVSANKWLISNQDSD